MNTATTIDCRGQRCPAPILATARAARGLGRAGGGVLEISADDDAFPFDIRSWCRSSGSELLQLQSDATGSHTAIVRVGAQDDDPPREPGLPPVPGPPPMPRLAKVPTLPPIAAPCPSDSLALEVPAILDFRGQRCPEPILGLARKARTIDPGTLIEVVADDPAFRLDLESWSRSAGATIVSMEPEGADLHALVRIGGTSRDGAVTTRIPHEPVGPVVVSLRGIAPAHCLPQLESQLAGRRHERVRVVADDPAFAAELMQWIASSGHRLLSLDARGSLEVDLELGAAAPPTSTALVGRRDAVRTWPVDDRCTLLVLHNDREALLAALLVAVGAASQGMNVMMFFTFWGLNLLRGEGPNPLVPAEKVSWAQRMFKWMMPRGPRRQKLGKLNMGGIGGSMLGSIMKEHQLMDIPELMATAEEQGVRFVACTMSMQVMGITKRDLAPRPNLEYGGVAAFVESAGRSRMSLTF